MSQINRRDATLVTNNVIDSFFGRFLTISRNIPIAELIVVSPWITPWEAKESRLENVCREIHRRRLKTYIVTTFPSGASANSHWNALKQFHQCESVMVTELPNLHAKFYVCVSTVRPFALVCSANLTNHSLSNSEIGVLLDAGPNFKDLIEELSEFGKLGLPTHPRAKPFVF